MSPQVAHAVRRILVGSAGVDPVSIPAGPFRILVDRLRSAPVDDRPGVLRLFAEARDDGDAIIAAVARADPSAPIPEGDDPTTGPGAEAEPAPWEPIRLDDPIRVDPFPLDVLPLAARTLALDAARSVGCPVDFPAAATLAVAAGAIGRSVVLQLKARYLALSALWIAVFGAPSDGKTPAVDAAFEATAAIDRVLQAEHAAAMEAWRGEGKEKAGATPPRPRRIDVDDCTTEALVGVMADNPRGLLQHKDELAEFLHGMDQYRSGGKGSDRPKYCSIWAGKRLKIDRAKHQANIPIRVDRPCLSLFGPLVPDRLASLVGDQGADGFLDRFLFVYPAQLPVPQWSERGIDDEVADAWGDLVRRLWERPMATEDGRSCSHVAYLNGDARAAWVGRHAAHVAEMNDDEFPAHLRGAWGKLREYAGRLALVLALMHHAADPGNDPAELPDVTAADVDRAWELVAYFASHARKVYGRISGGRQPGDIERQAVLRWIRAAPRDSFSESELTQARKTLRNNPELRPALDRLVREGYLRAAPDPADHKPRSPRYLVHPDLAGGPADPADAN